MCGDFFTFSSDKTAAMLVLCWELSLRVLGNVLTSHRVRRIILLCLVFVHEEEKIKNLHSQPGLKPRSSFILTTGFFYPPCDSKSKAFIF